MSAAYYLALAGHDVTIYEQRKQLGGMLRYGIPSYRLPREILDKEIRGLLDAGIKVVTDVKIGDDISIGEIRSGCDAMYVSIGAHVDRKIGIEGEDADGVLSAVEMLRGIGDNDMPDFTGLDVVVVGGGNVAMDVARSAVRLGAKTVRIAYRRRKVDMTALPEEVEGAIAEGCEVVDLHAPLRIEKDENGKVAALWVKPQMVGEIKGGRPAPVDSGQPEVRMACDRVLVAIGQGIDSLKFGEYGIPIKRGAIEAFDWSGVKNTEGIFAGGDCVTGPATVIRAIAAGKVAAANIDEYLGFHHRMKNDVEIPPVRLDDHNTIGRINMKERPADERKRDFKLMECGMTEEEACQEAGRCLRCDHFGYGIFKGGRVGKMVKLTIDGRQIEVPENTTILEAAARAGIRIPTLCFLKGLNEIGACRVCMVEIEGYDKLFTACNNTVKEGMVIYTNSQKSQKHPQNQCSADPVQA